MKLYYEKKFYKDIDDATAQKIGDALTQPRRPYHIDVDGEFLKTSLIEIRADDATTVRSEHKVPIEEIKQFERTYTEWKQRVPPAEQSMEFFAAVHGLITLHGVYLAPSGIKRCTNFSIIDPDRFTKFSRQYAALQGYHAKVDWAKRKEVQELEAKMLPA